MSSILRRDCLDWARIMNTKPLASWLSVAMMFPVTPDDSPEQLRLMAEQLKFTFPICFDESQETAKKFSAACTPDFFLFDGSWNLVYRGQMDESRPGSDKPVTGKDLRNCD